MKELTQAVDWVNQNHDDAARLSFDMMRRRQEDVKLFLDRVNFDIVSGDQLVKQVSKYIGLLRQEGIIKIELPDDFEDMFRL